MRFHAASGSCSRSKSITSMRVSIGAAVAGIHGKKIDWRLMRGLFWSEPPGS